MAGEVFLSVNIVNIFVKSLSHQCATCMYILICESPAQYLKELCPHWITQHLTILYLMPALFMYVIV